MELTKENPLGTEPVGKLMLRFAVPSIIAMLVGALYNIVDQLFIGQVIGPDGNAATNIAFPFTTSCISLALMFGIGGASCFNLALGRGEKEKAPFFIGNSLVMLAVSGILLLAVLIACSISNGCAGAESEMDHYVRYADYLPQQAVPAGLSPGANPDVLVAWFSRVGNTVFEPGTEAVSSATLNRDVQTTTESGDIVLYSSNQMVVFYGSNSWAYTCLGKITDRTPEEMRDLLGNGDVTVRLTAE